MAAFNLKSIGLRFWIIDMSCVDDEDVRTMRRISSVYLAEVWISFVWWSECKTAPGSGWRPPRIPRKG